MTEQNESMIRLLKTVNGKEQIVGYEKKTIGIRGYVITKTEDLEGFCNHHVGDILYDSFNPSFKFGDKWIFEGDKIEYFNYFESERAVIAYENYCWYLKNEIGAIWAGSHEIQSIIVTGNIYEE